MAVTVLHTGSTKKFAAGWEQIFGNKRSTKSAAEKASSGSTPKAAKVKPKSAKKKAAPAKKRK